MKIINFFKRIKLIVLSILISMLLVACPSTSSHKPIKRPSNDGGYSGLDEERIYRASFGAIETNRNYINQPIQFETINLTQKVSNPSKFKQQVQAIQTSNNYLRTDNSQTYQKINNWLNAGGNFNNLQQYGLSSRVLRGVDGYQNTLLTGYYSPVLKASLTKNGKYKYPLYRKPSSDSLRRKSRADIYNGALENKGLELAYSTSMLDNFLFGVQGSGFVDLNNGGLTYFAYDGQNGYKYQAIGRLLVEQGEIKKEDMSIATIRKWASRQSESTLKNLLIQNPSYVYYRMDPKGKVIGSAGVPLIPMAAVASDRSVIPSGSVLLVEIPNIDTTGKWLGTHTPHLMIALDKGGAVNNQHLDVYLGIGDHAAHKAGLMKHYGRVWILN